MFSYHQDTVLNFVLPISFYFSVIIIVEIDFHVISFNIHSNVSVSHLLSSTDVKKNSDSVSSSLLFYMEQSRKSDEDVVVLIWMAGWVSQQTLIFMTQVDF